MVQSTIFAAVAALALTGGASAQFGNGTFPINGTTSAFPSNTAGVTNSPSSLSGNATVLPTLASTTSTASSTSAAPTASDPVFCPNLSGKIIAGPLSVSYSISCDVSRGGALIDIDFLLNLAKRQTAPVSSLQDCLNVCSSLPACVATAFDTNNPKCFYYSSLTNAFQANGLEFAQVASRGLPANNSTSSSIPASSPVSSGAMFPTGGNSTSSVATTSGVATGSSVSTTSPATTSAASRFCPSLNGQVIVDATGFSFIVECGTNHFGVVIDINFAISKRQVATGASTLSDCVALCRNNAACVGTGFNSAQRTCTLFSSIGASFVDPNVEFAVINSKPSVITPGQTVTSTIYAPSVVTIPGCAPTITNCPANAGPVVVTRLVAVSTTVYVCPTLTTVAGYQAACTTCPYAAITASAYSETVVTKYACAPTVVNCPYNNVPVSGTGNVVTGVVTAVVSTVPAGGVVTQGNNVVTLNAPSPVTSTVTNQVTGYVSSETVVTAIKATVVNYPVLTASNAGGAVVTPSVITSVGTPLIQTASVGNPLVQTASASVGTPLVQTGSGSGSGAGGAAPSVIINNGGSTVAVGASGSASVATKSGTGAATTTSKLAVFTGAADKLNAGAIAGVVAAGFALML